MSSLILLDTVLLSQSTRKLMIPKVWQKLSAGIQKFGTESTRRIPEFLIYSDNACVKFKMMPPVFKLLPKYNDLEVMDRPGRLLVELIQKDATGAWKWSESEVMSIQPRGMGELVAKLTREENVTFQRPIYEQNDDPAEAQKPTDQYRELGFFCTDGKYKLRYNSPVTHDQLEVDLQLGEVEIIKAIAKDSLTYVTGFRRSL